MKQLIMKPPAEQLQNYWMFSPGWTRYCVEEINILASCKPKEFKCPEYK